MKPLLRTSLLVLVLGIPALPGRCQALLQSPAPWRPSLTLEAAKVWQPAFTLVASITWSASGTWPEQDTWRMVTQLVPLWTGSIPPASSSSRLGR